MAQYKEEESCAVKIDDTTTSIHIHDTCETLKKDCCAPEVSAMAGSSGLYNNLIHEQNLGENVWHYYEKVSLIG